MPVVQVVAAIIVKNNQVLIAQRPVDKHKGGYWEFPGGKIEPLETAAQALSRELREELNITVLKEDIRPFCRVEFAYVEKNVSLQFFKVQHFEGIPEGMEGQAICWVFITELINYRFPEANLPVIKKLRSFLSLDLSVERDSSVEHKRGV